MKTTKLVNTIKDLMQQFDCSIDEAFEPVMDKHSISFVQYTKVKNLILNQKIK